MVYAPVMVPCQLRVEVGLPAVAVVVLVVVVVVCISRCGNPSWRMGRGCCHANLKGTSGFPFAEC